MCTDQGISTTFAPDTDLPAVFGNAGELTQLVLNLLMNAIQAMPQGGEIYLETARDGSTLLVRVRDTGHGIEAQQLPHIFEPFFTTSVQGNGLGLAISKRIAEAHSGEITVHSTPELGSTFTVRLPLQARPGEPLWTMH